MTHFQVEFSEPTRIYFWPQLWYLPPWPSLMPCTQEAGVWAQLGTPILPQSPDLQSWPLAATSSVPGLHSVQGGTAASLLSISALPSLVHQPDSPPTLFPLKKSDLISWDFVMIFNINQNQLPATGGWGRKGEEKSKQSQSGLPEIRGKRKSQQLRCWFPWWGQASARNGASLPRFLETRKWGLAEPPFLQVNQLSLGGGRYWFSFLSLTLIPTPPFTLPLTTPLSPS